jgi:mannose-6-phosphate isomerase-like protein (cupin superfamily)
LTDWEDMNTEYVLKDYGPRPLVINIEKASRQNGTFRTALWTGDHLQVTLMSLNAGEDIGTEIHPELDQFLRIEQGRGLAQICRQTFPMTTRLLSLPERGTTSSTRETYR